MCVEVERLDWSEIKARADDEFIEIEEGEVNKWFPLWFKLFPWFCSDSGLLLGWFASEVKGREREGERE